MIEKNYSLQKQEKSFLGGYYNRKKILIMYENISLSSILKSIAIVYDISGQHNNSGEK